MVVRRSSDWQPEAAYHNIAAVTSTRTFEAAWYAHGYLRELVLIYPTYAIMMGETGISPLELSTLFVIWAGTALVLEVPSGTLADLYSRKWLLVISNLLKASAFVVWLFEPHFAGFAIGFVLWGTGSSLASGTSEALLFDTLTARGDPDAFARIYGRGVAANGLGVATALFLGGYLAESGFLLPLALSAIAPALAAMVVLTTFTEVRVRTARTPSFASTVVSGLRAAASDRWVAFAIGAFAVFVGTYGTLEEYVGPFLVEKETVSLTVIGVIYGTAHLARSLGVAFAHRLGAMNLRSIVAMFGVMAIPLAATQHDDTWLIGAGFSLYFAGSAAAEILLQTALQARIDGATRATVTSVASMGNMLVGMALLLAMGTAAESFGWHFALIGAALFTALAALSFLAAQRAL